MTADTPVDTPVRPPRRIRTVSAVLTGTAAAFGLTISGGLLAVVFAGVEQWANLPAWLDDASPYAVLLAGLALAGRVAADVAGRYAAWCGLGAGLLVLAAGAAVSRSSEAHGDGLEMPTVYVSAVVVALAVAAFALLSRRLRRE
ncbi:hypothetical protein [Nocardioides sp. LS1]|uniref:hypothetical protein n=1 Tax=Nocardioides sp. LS1 TaxID=1027620 RepID=UPI000F61886A|nr:hypothetical protein [Nocardioides sp. LS1]GCD89988.1 hypothetical protein NLS1_19940 [Nocardioides sp. LS1]